MVSRAEKDRPMTPCRALISKEPELLDEIERMRKRILAQESRLNAAIQDCVLVKVRIAEFNENEYWPRVGVYKKELTQLRNQLFGGPPPAEEAPALRAAAKEAPETSEPEKRDIKALYRTLVKMYHPDSAQSPEDKAFCHARMAAVNSAFDVGDIDSLRRFLKNAKAELASGGASSLARLSALRLDEEVLAEILALYARRLEDLKSSPSHRLMEEVRSKAQAGVDMLEELAADAKRRIRIYQELFTLQPQSAG